MSKTSAGNFFDDFRLGQEIAHATPRTVTAGDVALYTALYGGRFAVNSSDAFAAALGLPAAPVDELLVFHIVFGKTVPEVSLNAVANLGYADGRFAAPVYPGDTLAASSLVIGLKENSNRKTGVVYVRSTGRNQRGETVVEYVRWVIVAKREAAAPQMPEPQMPDPQMPEPQVPDLPDAVAARDLAVPEGLDLSGYDSGLAGAAQLWDDYAVGERIDHVDGTTVEEAEHALATRLYQNTARVHFDGLAAAASRFGRRVVYGGHVISLARALSFNGLANGFRLAAINGGRHVAPVFAGDTVYAFSEVLDKAELPGRRDAGALRLRTVALKDRPATGFPYKDEAGAYDAAVVLDFDYWVLMPRGA